LLFACTEYVKKYAKADDIASKGGSDGSGSDDDAAFLSSSDDDEETPGDHAGRHIHTLARALMNWSQSMMYCHTAECVYPLLQVI
jgi:hypothetical protein